MTILVETKRVSKDYYVPRTQFWKKPKPVAAVNEIDLTINKGEIVGLIGESGSGKSTLGRLITKLIQSTSGNIFFDGVDITHLSHKEMIPYYRKMQLIFQDSKSSLNPRKTIGEQLISPMLRLGAVDSRYEAELSVHHMLEKVGMKREHIYRYPHEFSGGQCQRIGIARALAVNPQFLVLDEPTSALDVSIQAQILNLLLDIKEEFNLTYLFIAHNLAIVEFFCDRVVVMEKGNLVDNLGVSDLHKISLHPATRNLLDSVLA